MLNKKNWLFLLLTTMLLVLVACGGSGNTEIGNSSNSNTETNNENEQNVLVYGSGGEPSTLDPASTTEGEASKVTSQMLEGLVQFERDSFEVLPDLAKDWEISDDGLTYTFLLEEGVTFHDGTDFNAEAVKINFERWADPDHEYAFISDGFVYPRYGPLFGGYKGDEDHVIDEINVINDYEIEFVLKRPSGIFLRNLAVTSFNIMSPAALEEYGPAITENPVGTGPFKLAKWDKDQAITLERFDDYREEGLPILDRVIYEVIPDNSARLIALRSGDIDIMDGLNIDDAPGVEEDENLDLYTRAENNIGYLEFNVEKAPLDNKLVRQAIGYAIDRKTIVDAMFGDYGNVALNPFPSSEIGYNRNIEFTHDKEKAKELLAEAGYADGLEIELWVIPIPRPYLADPETVSEIIQHDLAEIGIDVKIVREEWAAYLDKIQEGEQQMFMLGGTGINGDPSYGMNHLLHSDSVGIGNTAFYSNPEVDKLLDEANLTTDEDDRIALYEEIQRLVNEDLPMVPLVHSKPVMAASKNVHNFIPHPSTKDLLKDVEIK